MKAQGGGSARMALVVAALALLLGGASIPADSGAGELGELGQPAASLPPKATGSDFNGDGFADLAVAGEDWAGAGESGFPGLVYVLYGSPSGLSRVGAQRWTAADFVAGDRSEEFGEALTIGDFDGDGYSDLAIGMAELPYGDAVRQNAGRVRIVYGSRAGLSRTRSQQWSQNSPGIRGRSENEDGFGSVLVAGDFGRGPQDDLAIGVAGENGYRGAVNVIYGSAGGLTAVGNQLWSQTTRGIPGRRSVGDDEERFGLALAAGRFAGSVHADLAIGVPGDRVAGEVEAGSVNVLYGSAEGLSVSGAALWSQQTPGIKGRAEAVDGFGTSLAAGHFAGRPTADLAVGVAGENGYRGAVNVIYGRSGGLSAKGDQLWSRRTRGLGDRSRLDSDLGERMVAGSFGLDDSRRRYDDLVVTAYDNRGVNLVEVVYGTSRGLGTKRSRAWDLDSPGVAGEMVPSGTSFGSALAAGDFGNNVGGRADDDLVIADDAYDGGLFVVLNGSRSGLTAQRNRLWTAASFGLPDLMYLGRALAAG